MIYIDTEQLQDGLYNIKDGKIYKYKAKGGTVRAYKLTRRPQGEWIRDRYWSRGVGMGEDYGFFYKCSLCEYEVESGYTRCGFNFCPYCGCRMKGADDEQ